MKRYLFAAAVGVLALSQVNADSTGRAFIRTAEPAPAAAAPVSAPVEAVPASMVVAAGPGCAGGNCGGGVEAPRDPRLGIHPFFHHLIWWKHSSCSECGKKCGGLFGPRCDHGLGRGFGSGFGDGNGNGFGHGFGHGRGNGNGNGQGDGDGFNPYPNGVPGTLVFPQHPFVRSPRDFWIWEAK